MKRRQFAAICASCSSVIETLESRCLLSGQLDPAFAGGVVYGPNPTSGDDVAVQSDGKVLVLYDRRAGSAGFAPLDGMCVARYNTNGTLDKSFGTGGVATATFGPRLGLPAVMRLQGDGKILVGGYARTVDANGAFVTDNAGLARFTTSGQLDTTFSGDGKIVFDTPQATFAYVADIAVASTGKIILALSQTGGATSAVARLLPGGALDSTFDGDGVRLISDVSPSTAHLATLPGNKMIFVGYGKSTAPTVLRRLIDNGSTDPTFNGGRPWEIKNFRTYSALTDSQGKLTLVGESPDNKLTFQRFTASSGRDMQFGNQGIKTLDIVLPPALEAAYAADGKIVVGSVTHFNGGDMWVGRFTANADVDGTFGVNGISTAPLPELVYTADVAPAPDGNIVLGGYVTDPAQVSTDLRYVAARFVGNGSGPAAHANIVDSVLTVEGTNGNDSIYLNDASNGAVTAIINNQTLGTFAKGSFSSVVIRGLAGNDVINGSSYAERIEGGDGSDWLNGNGGDDTLDGGKGGDNLSGGAGNDTADYSSRTAPLTIGIGTLADDGEAGEKDNVYLDIETVLGGTGNDSIKGGAANNLLVGNAGNDTLRGNFGDDTLSGDAGTDLLDGEAGTDTAINAAGDSLVSIEINAAPAEDTAILGADGTLTVTGTQNQTFPGDGDRINVTLTADDKVTVTGITGQPSFDRAAVTSVVVNALGGDDAIYISSTNSQSYNIPTTILGGTGADWVALSRARATFYAGDGNDHLESNESLITGFDGGEGQDSFVSNDSASQLIDLNFWPGVEDADIQSGTLLGNALGNGLSIHQGGVIDGRGGDDFLGSQFGAYTIRGGDGNDTIFAGDGTDSVDGGAGDDIIKDFRTPDFGKPTGDIFKGGDGNDTMDYRTRTGNLTIGIGTLADDGEAGEHDNVYLDIENVIGGLGNDSIKGGAGNNMLTGSDGNDTLRGNFGDDTLSGDSGTDILDGESGNDTAINSAGDQLISIEHVA